jgi:hypothetical protein
LSAAIYLGTALVYTFFASAKLQSWGISHSENVDNNEKEFNNISKARKTNNNNHNNEAFVPD